MSSSVLDKVTMVMFTSFGTMLIGLAVARAEFLPEPARKGVSLLYAKLVFPMMVFRGVAEINLGGARTRHARALLCGLLPCCPCPPRRARHDRAPSHLPLQGTRRCRVRRLRLLQPPNVGALDGDNEQQQ